MDNFTEDQQKVIKNMGALGYDAARISSIMGFEVKAVESWLNGDCIFRKIYDDGARYAEYLIDLKLFEMAQAGDLKAMEKLEKKKESLKKSLENEMFY
jgi:hypothetical protein